MDNVVMIQAGQYIDSTLGVYLGLATMTAAAAGQVVSDVSGVVFGKAMARFLNNLNLIRSPSLTNAQRQLSICRNVSMAGAVIGVTVGCALGAMTLLVVDLEARDRIQRAMQLRDIVTDMISQDDRSNGAMKEQTATAGLQCDTCTVYLTDIAQDFDFDKLQESGNSKEKGGPGGGPRQRRTQLELLRNAPSDCAAKQCADERQVILDSHAMYAPLLKYGTEDVMAVLEFRHDGDKEKGDRNDTSSSTSSSADAAVSTTSGFSPQDVRTAQVMTRHLALFMRPPR